MIGGRTWRFNCIIIIIIIIIISCGGEIFCASLHTVFTIQITYLFGISRFDAQYISCDRPRDFMIIAFPNHVRSLALQICNFV